MSTGEQALRGLRRMPVIEPPIDEIVQRIVEQFHPRRIVLFGSRSRGTAYPDSDVDLMVEMETELKRRDRELVIDGLFGARDWSMDLFVYTPAEVERERDTVGSLLYTIMWSGYGPRRGRWGSGLTISSVIARCSTPSSVLRATLVARTSSSTSMKRLVALPPWRRCASMIA